MANLFDVESPKAQTTALPSTARNLHFKELERLKQVENGAVVNWKWLGTGCLPPSVRLSAFKKWESIRIEEFAPVGRQYSEVVVDSAMNGTEGREQAWKSVRSRSGEPPRPVKPQLTPFHSCSQNWKAIPALLTARHSHPTGSGW